MITATWAWIDLRNFEENAPGYQRVQLAWAATLAAALVLVVAMIGWPMIRRHQGPRAARRSERARSL